MGLNRLRKRRPGRRIDGKVTILLLQLRNSRAENCDFICEVNSGRLIGLVYRLTLLT